MYFEIQYIFPKRYYDKRIKIFCSVLLYDTHISNN